MFKRSVVALVSALLIASALASCGDDDGSSSDSPGSVSISKAEFVQEAEKICIRESDKANARVAPYVERNKEAGGGSKSEEDLQAEAIEAVVLPSVERQIDQIRDLGVPTGDEDQVEDFLTALGDAIEVFREAPLTPRANAAFSRVNRVGRAYGLERCAYG